MCTRHRWRSCRNSLQDVFFHPLNEAIAIAGNRVPFTIKRAVAAIISVDIGWPRTTGCVDDGRDDPGWNDDSTRYGLEPFSYFFNGDDDTLRGKHRFLLNSNDTPQLNVAFFVGALGMNNRDIGLNGSNCRDLLAGVGTINRIQSRRVFEDVGLWEIYKSDRVESA